MPEVTISGIYGSSATNTQDLLNDIQHQIDAKKNDEESANDKHYNDLETYLQEPSTSFWGTGSLCINNINDPTQELQFERKHWIKAYFRTKSNKVSAMLLIAMFERRGFNTDGLKQYLQNRNGELSGRRIQVDRILRFMDNNLPQDKAVEVENTDSIKKGKELGAGGLGKVYEATWRGKTFAYKELGTNLVRIEKESAQGENIKRSKEICASHMHLQPESKTLAPQYYVVTVNAQSKLRTFIVPSGKFLRQWSKERLYNDNPPPTSMQIVGLLMPKAKGKNLSELIHEKKVSRKDLISISGKLLKILREYYSEHGFMHNDLKETNIMYDAATGEVELIDTTSLAKHSKNSDRERTTILPLPNGYTKSYAHPMLKFKQRCGFEHDLFALGMTMIYADMESCGMQNEAKALRTKLSDSFSAIERNQESQRAQIYQDLRQLISQSCPDDKDLPLANLGKACIEVALDMPEKVNPTWLLPCLDRKIYQKELDKILEKWQTLSASVA